MAWADWAMHLAASPGKRMRLQRLAAQNLSRYFELASGHGWQDANNASTEPVEPPPSDRLFADPMWNQYPFTLLRESFSMQTQWWEEATHNVWGVSPHHQKSVAFSTRQILDAFSPRNWLFTNPVALQRTVQENGDNLARGWSHFLDDVRRQLAGLPAPGIEHFQVGRDVATTPGKVVLKNRLIELIQYSPATAQVHPEPILIVPAWIMKYYILDLSPKNSLIKYLVEQGHTVFCISWKNPDAEDRDLGMDEYLSLGIEAALGAINVIVPDQKIHAAGYCLGGTLLAIAAAAAARNGDERVASLSLLAAQTDFSEPGDISQFIDESQVALLEAQMAETGYLGAEQMAGAFQALRSRDLIWSRVINEYLLGERRPPNDLMAWNADATRMPAKMHSQYLRCLFLDNALAEGRYQVGGRAVSLADVNLPIFCVGTESDHVAPWQSVYKLHHLSPAEITFVLTSGGHNAGIVSEPGHPRRRYRVCTRPAGGPSSIAAEEWAAGASERQGSWWVEWLAWLQARSTAKAEPPLMGGADKDSKALDDAPGAYVEDH